MSEANIWEPREEVRFSVDNKTGEQSITAVANQSIFFLTSFTYAVGTGALAVYKEGVRLNNSEWNEVDGSSFNLVVGAAVGDVITAVGFTSFTAAVPVVTSGDFPPVDTLALLKTLAVPVGASVSTVDFYSSQSGGGAPYRVKTAAQAAADSDVIDGWGNHTMTSGDVLILQDKESSHVAQWGAIPDGLGNTDNTAAFLAYKDYCIANTVTMRALDGDFWFVGDLDLWGVLKIEFACKIVFTLTSTNIIVGGNTIGAPSMNINLYICTGTVLVHGMNRGDFKLNTADTLHLLASDGFSLQRFTVSYSRFEWVNVSTFHMECQDPAGLSGAWMNENNFFCGRARVSFLMDGTYPMNNNIFYGLDMESMTIAIEIGQNNHFHDVRLEGNCTFTFGSATFNNIFWQSWGNFANTAIWGYDVATYNITDLGDNNRIVSAHYAYTEKDVILNIDRENLGDGVVFRVSPTNADKVQIINNAITICDTGKIQVTDKLWFRHTGQTASFFIFMEVYDEDGAAITVEPSAGFKTSQGATSFNTAGFYEYTSPVLGGAYAINPNKEPAVKYVRFLVKTDNGASGDEHTNVRSVLVQPQKDKYPAKNLAGDVVSVDVLSNRVSSVSKTTAIDLFKFTSGAFTTTDASGVLAGQLNIALTAEKGSTEDATMATVNIMVTKEDVGVMVITTDTPVFLSNGGSLLIDGIILATKAGATATESILTITIISSSHIDPFDSLNARARLTGIADYNKFASYLIAASKV